MYRHSSLRWERTGGEKYKKNLKQILDWSFLTVSLSSYAFYDFVRPIFQNNWGGRHWPVWGGREPDFSSRHRSRQEYKLDFTWEHFSFLLQIVESWNHCPNDELRMGLCTDENQMAKIPLPWIESDLLVVLISGTSWSVSSSRSRLWSSSVSGDTNIMWTCHNTGQGEVIIGWYPGPAEVYQVPDPGPGPALSQVILT